MTIEEAGQILLEFKPYILCERCQKNIREKRRILNEKCPDCKAWGVIVNPRYARACEVVGMKPPQPIEQIKIAEVEALERKFEREREDVLR